MNTIVNQMLKIVNQQLNTPYVEQQNFQEMER